MQAPNRFPAQTSRGAIRPQPCAVQRFVCVDVADARDGRLVEQHCLHWCAASPKAFEQCFRVEGRIDGLGSKLGQRPRDEQLVLRAKQQPAEPPRVAIAKLPSQGGAARTGFAGRAALRGESPLRIVEVEDRMRVVRDFGGRIDKTELSRHPEVDHEQSPSVECDEDELSSPTNGLDAHIGDGVDERLRLGMPDDGREAQLAVDDRSTEKVRPQVRNDGLDLWKLWHQTRTTASFLMSAQFDPTFVSTSIPVSSSYAPVMMRGTFSAN